MPLIVITVMDRLFPICPIWQSGNWGFQLSLTYDGVDLLSPRKCSLNPPPNPNSLVGAFLLIAYRSSCEFFSQY